MCVFGCVVHGGFLLTSIELRSKCPIFSNS
jgi:hypothetical protein